MKQERTKHSKDKALHLHLVDDDEIFLKLHQVQFKRLGLCEQIYLAASGDELVSNLAELISGPSSEDLHLIFLDLNMPVYSGWDVLEYLRAKYIKTQVMVVVVSSSVDPQEVAKCFQYPQVLEYIPKPLNQEDLKQVFARHGFSHYLAAAVNHGQSVKN